MPWFLPYLLNFGGGSVRFNPNLTFLPYKVTFKPRPQEAKQCIFHCENTCRSSTSYVMASSYRAPKQWCLSKVETNSFENWKQNLLYTLSLDSNFAPFLADAVQWLKKTKTQPLRGLEADGDSIPLTRRLTARQKVNFFRADARSDWELLPYHFPKHFGEKFNVTRIHLANYSPALWFPSHRCTIYRFF